MLLPLVEVVSESYQGSSLDNMVIIGVQHILETTHSMFQSLYELGLKPKNIMLLGKCYSTCQEVYEEMIADGIDVDPNSLSYSSHVPFDAHFQDLIEKFITQRIGKLESQKIEKIIILDDGGKCIEIIQDKMESFAPLVAVEQTSSGFEALNAISLAFPVINVARSDTKLRLESPMIAEAAVQRLLLSMKKAKRPLKKALIIGGGSIGLAMQQKLKEQEVQTTIYDIKDSKESLLDLLKTHNLILGCTGKTSVTKDLHQHLHKDAVLASVSSSDREFDAVHLRKKVPKTDHCHSDLEISGVLLVRNGFPVNFDGERENIEPELIQLTIALMAAGILQGIQQGLEASLGIIPLKKQWVELIEDNFIHLAPGEPIIVG